MGDSSSLCTPATLAAGGALGLGARSLLVRALRARFGADLEALNRGEYGPLLSRYADDAVLRFHPGDHRWGGEHRGRPAIERFLRDFTAAGLRGEIKDVLIAGAPWRLRLAVRFDDEARGPDGELLYRNRVVLVLRTRFGRVVEHDDFYEDTSSIDVLERRLRELGVPRAA